MIAAAPTAAASQFTDVISAARAYINSATGLAADGLTWVEVGELMMGFLRLTIQAAEVLNVPGEQKKAVVLEAAAWLFDAIADKAVPAMLWPVWMLARSPVRSLVLALASGAVEILVPMVRAH
ncbi:MAG: hypothetical protein HQ464_02580 [Planctomycetes bacterium]|nr:hypothetical protein [Planctomycetota bacterium]